MKLQLLCVATLAFSAQLFAQKISFEEAEGYQLGNINGQKTWISTGAEVNSAIDHQEITNETAFDGTNALKLQRDPSNIPQTEPRFGAYYHFEEVDAHNYSFHFKVDKVGNYNYYGFQGFNTLTDTTIFQINLNDRGEFWVTSSLAPTGHVRAEEFRYVKDKWYKVQIEFNETNTRYYVDGKLILDIAEEQQLKFDQIKFIHNNFEGTLFIDEIDLGKSEMSTENTSLVKGIKVSQNTQLNTLQLTADAEIKEITILSFAGQILKQISVKQATKKAEIKIADLPKGSYLLNLKTSKGDFSQKFIKK